VEFRDYLCHALSCQRRTRLSWSPIESVLHLGINMRVLLGVHVFLYSRGTYAKTLYPSLPESGFPVHCRPKVCHSNRSTSCINTQLPFIHWHTVGNSSPTISILLTQCRSRRLATRLPLKRRSKRRISFWTRVGKSFPRTSIV
jgi:hypothetical protein